MPMVETWQSLAYLIQKVGSMADPYYGDEQDFEQYVHPSSCNCQSVYHGMAADHQALLVQIDSSSLLPL